jgi:hypothetical protein
MEANTKVETRSQGRIRIRGILARGNYKKQVLRYAQDDKQKSKAGPSAALRDQK